MTRRVDDYGKGTKVTRTRRMANIEEMFDKAKLGVKNIQWGRNDDLRIDFFSFEVGATGFRYIVPLPAPDDHRVTHKIDRYSHREVKVTDRAQLEERHKQIINEVWAGVELSVHAALVEVARGIQSIEEILAAEIITSNGMTVREMVRAQVIAREGNPQLPVRIQTLALPPPSDKLPIRKIKKRGGDRGWQRFLTWMELGCSALPMTTKMRPMTIAWMMATTRAKTMATLSGLVSPSPTREGHFCAYNIGIFTIDSV